MQMCVVQGESGRGPAQPSKAHRGWHHADLHGVLVFYLGLAVISSVWACHHAGLVWYRLRQVMGKHGTQSLSVVHQRCTEKAVGVEILNHCIKPPKAQGGLIQWLSISTPTKAPNTWHRQGTQITGNTYNQHKRPPIGTTHRPSKGQPKCPASREHNTKQHSSHARLHHTNLLP